MILILLAILLLGIGIYRFAQIGPQSKNWIMLFLFVVAVCVILYYAGVLRMT